MAGYGVSNTSLWSWVMIRVCPSAYSDAGKNATPISGIFGLAALVYSWARAAAVQSRGVSALVIRPWF